MRCWHVNIFMMMVNCCSDFVTLFSPCGQWRAEVEKYSLSRNHDWGCQKDLNLFEFIFFRQVKMMNYLWQLQTWNKTPNIFNDTSSALNIIVFTPRKCDKNKILQIITFDTRAGAVSRYPERRSRRPGLLLRRGGRCSADPGSDSHVMSTESWL